ncbi:MAG: hypothetical protein HC893_07775 [Chloroflexaceae bacterium]|nr:hypothetical protein [Chloroflexaceae bacterium]
MDLIEGYRGQVVKLSGDAITVFFEASAVHDGTSLTDQEQLRTATSYATTAAIAMQRAMVEFRRQKTSRGEARLDLK